MIWHAPPTGILRYTPPTLTLYGSEQERRNRARGTIERQRRVLLSLVRFVDPLPIEQTQRHHIEAWLDSRNLSPASRYAYLSAVATFFEWLMLEDKAQVNPTARIVRPRLPRRLPRPTPQADLAYAIAVADTRMRAWLLLASLQGLRCMEIAHLRRDDVVLDSEPHLLRIVGKGDKERILPLHPEVELALRSYGMRHGYLFRLSSGRPLKAGTVSSYINRFLHSHGISATAHTARHWFGTEMYRSTHDLRLTQEAMGHADPKTTSVYAEFDRAAMNDAVRGLSINGAAVALSG